MLYQPDDERAQGHRGCVIATIGNCCASMANGRDFDDIEDAWQWFNTSAEDALFP